MLMGIGWANEYLFTVRVSLLPLTMFNAEYYACKTFQISFSSY